MTEPLDEKAKKDIQEHARIIAEHASMTVTLPEGVVITCVDPGTGPLEEFEMPEHLRPAKEEDAPEGYMLCDNHEFTDITDGFQVFEITLGEDSVNWCLHCHGLYTISGEYLGKLEFVDGKITMTPKEPEDA